MTRRVGWLDCSSGVSGDMLLAAAVDAGADVAGTLRELDERLGSATSFTDVTRGGLRAHALVVSSGTEQPLRRLPDLLAVIDGLSLDSAARSKAVAVLRRLASAEAAVHGIGVDDVHFHEIGAVDTVLDVVGVCAGIGALALDRLVVSPVALGTGTTTGSHGSLPVPVPAVVKLLEASSLTAYGGPAVGELATPTGIALLAELADDCGPMPPLTVAAAGVGGGSRDLPDRPNVVRLVVGTAAEAEDAGDWLLLEANVDDLDPRVWPTVIDSLLTAGAADAWLTPILMKKGRPAFTLAALTSRADEAAVRGAMFRESSTIGLRTTTVGKHALDRRWRDVDVDGQRVRVKIASLDGKVLSATPEWDDVAAAARALERPAKSVLAAAVAAAGAVTG